MAKKPDDLVYAKCDYCETRHAGRLKSNEQSSKFIAELQRLGWAYSVVTGETLCPRHAGAGQAARRSN